MTSPGIRGIAGQTLPPHRVVQTIHVWAHVYAAKVDPGPVLHLDDSAANPHLREIGIHHFADLFDVRLARRGQVVAVDVDAGGKTGFAEQRPGKVGIVRVRLERGIVAHRPRCQLGGADALIVEDVFDDRINIDGVGYRPANFG